uniref:Uncharacterized protein n=1 Tax=Aegilops tauschii subsp. strangulata TaxID=200361 RepID=A0A453LKQ3_AEGTS
MWNIRDSLFHVKAKKRGNEVLLFIFLVLLQDSYALCRVFKKNVPAGEFEKQGECSSSQAKANQEQVTDFEDAGESSTANENDKDNSWMQFIVEDLWCSNKTK